MLLEIYYYFTQKNFRLTADRKFEKLLVDLEQMLYYIEAVV